MPGAENLPAAEELCRARFVREERAEEEDALLEGYDTDCDEIIDAVLRVPDDRNEPLELSIDRDGDGEHDVWIYDRDNHDRWDISFWDDDFNGEPDLVGHHLDGGSDPTEFEAFSVWEGRLAEN